MRLIGLRCKHGDMFSLQVLIGRGLDLHFLVCFSYFSLYSVFRVWKTLKRKQKPVQMAMRFHLFPFRTQKLSSYTPKILRWRRLGKIGLRRHFLFIYSSIAQSVERMTVNHDVAGSSPAWGAKLPLKWPYWKGMRATFAKLYSTLFELIFVSQINIQWSL